MLKKLGETAGKVQKMSTYTHIIWLLANVVRCLCENMSKINNQTNSAQWITVSRVCKYDVHTKKNPFHYGDLFSIIKQIYHVALMTAKAYHLSFELHTATIK